jgi:hypothetical protein
MTTALAVSKALLKIGGLILALSIILFGYDLVKSAADCNPCGPPLPPLTWFAYPLLFGLCLIALGITFWFRSRKGKPKTAEPDHHLHYYDYLTHAYGGRVGRTEPSCKGEARKAGQKD